MNLGSFKRAICSLDVVLSSAGILGALALILIALVRDKPSYAVVGIILLLACVAYLFLVRGTGFPDTSEPAQIPTLYLLCNILFFAGLMFSILSLYLRPDPYVRPLSYFVAIAVMAGILAAEIIILPRSKHSWLVLTQIMLIPLSLAWSQLLIFPTIIGDDAWYHQWFTQSMLDSGFIPGGSGYSRLPVLYFVSGTTALVTGLDYKIAALLSISSINIVCLLLFIFLLGRFVFNDKAGLLAALFLGISDTFVGWSYHIIASTFAALIIPAIIYVLFRLRKNIPITAVSLAMFLMATLILTHTVVSMSMAIILLVLWVGFAVFNRTNNQRQTPVTLGIVILFVVAMFGWWTYSSRHLTLLTHLIQWGFSIDYWLVSTPTYEGIDQYIHAVPVYESLFNIIGRYLFLGISVPGLLYMLSKRLRNPYALSLAFGVMAIVSVTLVASVFHYEIITLKWHYIGLILASIPLAVTLLLLLTKIRNGVGKILPVAVLTCVLAFLMIMTPLANNDNPLFKNTVIRWAYTESEVRAAETILRITDRTIVTDRTYVRYILFLRSFLESGISSLEKSLGGRDFTDLSDSIIVIRREISQSTLSVGVDSYIRLNYDPAQVLADEGFSHVYECGTVSAFWWNSNQPPSQGEP